MVDGFINGLILIGLLILIGNIILSGLIVFFERRNPPAHGPGFWCCCLFRFWVL